MVILHSQEGREKTINLCVAAALAVFYKQRGKRERSFSFVEVVARSAKRSIPCVLFLAVKIRESLLPVCRPAAFFVVGVDPPARKHGPPCHVVPLLRSKLFLIKLFFIWTHKATTYFEGIKPFSLFNIWSSPFFIKVSASVLSECELTHLIKYKVQSFILKTKV